MVCHFRHSESVIEEKRGLTLYVLGSSEEWGIVLRVAGVVAALPVVVFSLYGSAEKQHWAAPSSKSSVYSLSNSSRKTSTVSRKSAITNNN